MSIRSAAQWGMSRRGDPTGGKGGNSPVGFRPCTLMASAVSVLLLPPPPAAPEPPKRRRTHRTLPLRQESGGGHFNEQRGGVGRKRRSHRRSPHPRRAIAPTRLNGLLLPGGFPNRSSPAAGGAVDGRAPRIRIHGGDEIPRPLRVRTNTCGSARWRRVPHHYPHLQLPELAPSASSTCLVHTEDHRGSRAYGELVRLLGHPYQERSGSPSPRRIAGARPEHGSVIRRTRLAAEFSRGWGPPVT